MPLPTQRIRIVAGAPIEVEGYRLLPSVLVSALEGGDGKNAIFLSTKMRPVSFVEQGADGARWLEIPNATADAFSVMAGIGGGIAVVSLALLVLLRLVRG